MKTSPATISSIPSARTARATPAAASTSFIESITWKRRIPARTSNRNARRINSSLARSHEMNRIPGVRNESGVRGIRAAISRMRSHGFSRW